MRTERARLSRHNMLTRWPAFTRFLDDGRICLTDNAPERAVRCVAVGRRNWTFCGSVRGGERAAAKPRDVRHRASKEALSWHRENGYLG